jgi:hypothetical protein
MIKYIISLGLIASTCFAISKDENPFALKINQETFLTDKTGVFIPSNLIKLIPGNSIKIYLTDGTELNGLVKTTEMFNGEILKIFGEITNKNDAGFGFVLTKDAVFAGAVVFRDTDTTYAISYDELRKGFVLTRRISQKLGS